MEIWIKTLILAILIVLAIMDFRKKEVSLWLIILLSLAVVIDDVYERNTLFHILSGVSVGGVLIGLSFLLKDKIGLGDGFIVMALGGYLGGSKTIMMLLIASAIMAIIGGALLLTKRGKMDTDMPFIPAIALGYVISVYI